MTALIIRHARAVLLAGILAWLIFQSAELLANALYGPAVWPPQVEVGEGLPGHPRSERPPADPVGLASVTIVTGNGKD